MVPGISDGTWVDGAWGINLTTILLRVNEKDSNIFDDGKVNEGALDLYLSHRHL